MQELIIPGRLPGMNEIIKAARTNKYQAAKQKKTFTELVFWQTKYPQPVKTPVSILCVWYEKNKRRDPDNISAGIKFILDGLVHAKILQNDGWDQIKRIEHRFKVSEREGVKIFLFESGE